MMLRNKQIVLGAVSMGLLLGLTGCQTTQGVSLSDAYGFEGQGGDITGIWRKALEADDWVRKNLW
jgi:hypothetical protein